VRLIDALDQGADGVSELSAIPLRAIPGAFLAIGRQAEVQRVPVIAQYSMRTKSGAAGTSRMRPAYVDGSSGQHRNGLAIGAIELAEVGTSSGGVVRVRHE